MSRYQKGKTNLDPTGARDSERQRHQLGHTLETDNHARGDCQHPTTQPPQAGRPSCRPTNSAKALQKSKIQQ